ncbi:MG2 domain-containing protein [soil metagenome]
MSHHYSTTFWLGIAMSVLLTFASCKDKDTAPPKIDSGFSEYISAFTAGVISRDASIRILLADEYLGEKKIGEPIKETLFRFDPPIKGTATWVDNRTIDFKPEQLLTYATIYRAEFFLSKLKAVPKQFETFNFQFQTQVLTFDFNLGKVRSIDPKQLNWMTVSGQVNTTDVVDNSKLEMVIEATQQGKKLRVTWNHDVNGRMHTFIVDSIYRGDVESSLLINWDGKPLDIDKKGTEQLRIPSVKEFRLMHFFVEQQPEQYISLQFSDPLLENQELKGLLKLENSTDLKFTQDANELRVYPRSRQYGNKTLFIFEGLKNILGFKLGEVVQLNVSFEEIKPEIKLSLGDGVILPNSNGLHFPFEAVNLKAVDVTIIRIFENNIAQYLQVNQLGESREMKRVGRPVLRKTVRLDNQGKDLATWNTFALDMNQLFKSEPGAIYQVQLGFRKEHSLYSCPGDTAANAGLQNFDNSWAEGLGNEDDDYWDAAESYYYDYDYYEEYDDYYYDDYDYNERENPCNTAYYGQRHTKKQFILASDIGIIAKGSNNRQFDFAVADLVTTKPISGVTLELYNYQNQLLGTTKTGTDGLAQIKANGKPFLVIAKNGSQRGYLRLDDGSSLSLSKFDVGGEVIQKGVKGFIYGERGVWRPGDSLFITFVLEDKNNVLPKEHPVTFELVDPQGKLVERSVRNSGLNGVYAFHTKTDPDAPTGNWTGRVKVGGSAFTKTLKIETIKPNRLKIIIDFGKEVLSVMDKGAKGKLTVTWLHGAVARNLRANIKVTLNAINTSFEKYPDYEFDDPSRSFQSDEQTLYEGKVDENGEATLAASFDATGTAPGMLRANFVSRVFEESGDFSIDRFSVDYAPYESFVGIRVPEGSKWRNIIYTDTTHKIDIVSVDAAGKPINRDSLEVYLFKMDWRWWWESSSDYSSRFNSSNTTDRRDFKRINTKGGKGTYNLRVENGNWGRYMIKVCDPKSGHCTGKIIYVDWPGWASRSQSENPSGASMLVFATDKEKYKVGDEVNVTLPSSGVGRALVSIESGSKVLDTYWVEAGKGETKFKFKATPEMAPNVYINITLIQPHAQTANDLPIRMYGVIPLFVEDPNTRLSPIVEMPKVLEPETNFTLKVKEEKGKKMTYTIAIVDDGILDLTRFKTPDPWPVFYAREALGVMSWDMYDHVIGALAGKLNTLLSLGGDGEINGKAKNTAQRFKPMVRFLGPFELKAGQTATHKIDVPNYIGSVRTMVVASQEGAYGKTEVTTPVRKPLMVLATLPRVVGPGEKVKLPVTVFAMEKDVKTVDIQVIANPLLVLANGNKKTITFSAIGDQVIDFDINVAEKLGIGKVQVIVTSGKHKATYEIELNVRNPNPPVTTFKDIALEPGKSWETDYTPVGMDGTNKGTLELSGMPPIDLAGRLDYLIQYPHGCIEQTTSAAFPQLYLDGVVELSEKQKFAVSENIRAALNKLRSFQVHDGGFSYWPGGGYYNDWATTYAGHFMLEAEIKGYAPPLGMKDNWINYQTNKARNWTGHKNSNNYWNETDFTQAYRLYTLALAKKPEIGAMNRLKERPDISVEARWRLAAAYVIAGQPEAAKQLTNIAPEGPSKHDRNWYYYNYGSMDRDEAMILETMVLLGDNTRAFKLLQNISKALNGKQWMSTQTTAYCLIAVSKYAGKYAKQGGFTYTYSIDGAAPQKVSGNKPVAQYNIPIKGKNSGKVTVTNSGQGILYARIVLEGLPLTGQEKAFENNLVMNVTYKNLDGKTIDPTRLEQGTDFMAEVTIRNPDPVQLYKDMALSQIFPSGWEIHNVRMDGFDNVHTADRPDYEDIRDDRVYTYFSVWPQKTVTFRVLLNAAYQGEYYLSGPYCEAMYDNTITSAKAGKWVKVVKTGDVVGMK